MGLITKLANYRYEFINLISGAVVLTFELTAARIVAPYIGTTIYVWTSIIGIILAALALGYSLGGHLADKRHNPQDVVLLLLGASLLITMTNLLKDPILAIIGDMSMSLQWQALWSSLILFALPTVLLGAIYPYLVKLSLDDIGHTGRQVARIDGSGTIGALIGTFLSGYILFGYFGSRHILGFLAIILVLTSFLVGGKKLLPLKLSFLLITVLFFFATPKLFASGLKADIDTKYNRVTIREIILDNRPMRILQTDKQAWQSGIYLDNPQDLAFHYTRSFAAAASINPSAKNYLVIGGGAYTFPNYLAKNNPSARVDVVEIDDQLASISQEYFDFKLPGNLNIYQADGRQFINDNSRKYDIVYIDAFSSLTPPFQLFTAETVERIHNSLSKNGLVVVNIVSAPVGSRSEFTRALRDTYAKNFSSIAIFQPRADMLPDERQNLTLIASNKRLPNTMKYSPPDGGEPTSFSQAMADYSPGVVLTDDYAPVERLVQQ